LTDPSVAAAPENGAPAAEEPAISTDAPPPSHEQTAVPAQPVEPVRSAAASSAPAVVPPQPSNRVVRRPQPQPTRVDKAIDNAPWIGLLLLALAGAGYLVYNRRKQQAEEEQALEQEDVFAFNDTVAPADEPVDAPDFNDINEASLFDE